MPEAIQSKLLRTAPSPDAYALYRAGLEWDLTDPIVINSREDIKSVERWRDRVDPFNHQVGNLMTFCGRLPVTLLADDVGLGKTISAGLIMSELIARRRLTSTLIVCPKILGPQWKEELEQKFNIPARIAVGRELIAAEPDDVGAVITTYHSARTYLDQIPPARFEMLVLDEAHKLRNLFGTPDPPQVAKCFHRALQERRFRFVLMLTATPIQNRLWDLYSLVELLTAARGHTNPFGSEGMFARKFIDGDREKARNLKSEAAAEFRSIVYGYMSRVRRGDAKLHFPDRQVQLHRVDPTAAELRLIEIVAKGIKGLNRLAQIGILQALTSSPQALSAQLDNMARNGTIRPDFAPAVRAVVSVMPASAKLNGLKTLMERLKQENPERWRLVVFTGRRETQTTIVAFLEGQGLQVGVINGTSGSRNQETLAAFRANPPKIRAIVSTEAGSEGVNLQVANVLVNYDLPWNPMIVEQRIGRVQRLASPHASVGIFNITLKGTFEEYIVGRLMEKLQMSTSAIGDIESLLQGAVGGEEGVEGFEEKIRQLVVAALEGADVEKSTRLIAASIESAKQTLAEEEKRIDALLGGADRQAYVGPKSPELPKTEHRLGLREFVRQAFVSFKAKVSPQSDGTLQVEEGRGKETICFDADMKTPRSVLYAPGSPAFARLVERLTASGLHTVRDADQEPRAVAEKLAHGWVRTFDGEAGTCELAGCRRWFEGTALVRVRAVVAHDSYERLMEVACRAEAASRPRFDQGALAPLPAILEKPAATLGLDETLIREAVERDPGIAEFSRFYLERRAKEIAAAGQDERKREKMENDFTPRLTLTLLGADGAVCREIKLRVNYGLAGRGGYADELTVVPSRSAISVSPPLAPCAISRQSVPASALGTCCITGYKAIRHLLSKSDQSGRVALPDHIVTCELTGKRLLSDEVEQSTVSGRFVSKGMLRRSAISGALGEAEHFGTCAFTNCEALQSELRKSEFSGMRYRFDQSGESSLSHRVGHCSEIVECFETRALLARSEAEACAVTGHLVRPGVLQVCGATGSQVLPSQLATCSVSGRRVLKRLLVVSSVSDNQMLEAEAARSTFGRYCAPIETRQCGWTGQRVHPDDLRHCTLTGIEVHFQYMTPGEVPRLEPLSKMLDGIGRNADRQEVWGAAASRASGLLNKAKCRVEAAWLSPGRDQLAMVCEVRTMLGLRSRQLGFIYSIANDVIVGRIAVGKRGAEGWSAVS